MACESQLKRSTNTIWVLLVLQSCLLGPTRVYRRLRTKIWLETGLSWKGTKEGIQQCGNQEIEQIRSLLQKKSQKIQTCLSTLDLGWLGKSMKPYNLVQSLLTCRTKIVLVFAATEMEFAKKHSRLSTIFVCKASLVAPSGLQMALMAQ